MKIYTRTGDTGETALFGGGRVAKTHARVQAYGTVDELNAFLGRGLLKVESEWIRSRLSLVQHDLFALGAILATPPAGEGRRRPEVPPLPEGRILEMETWMDEADGELPPLRSFVLPGGSPGAAELHLCRTVCRRAERLVVDLAHEEPDVRELVRYLNRLSDVFFVMARLENHRTGAGDTPWEKEAP
ncbi:MAG: cob(I)yrinic acid a,c-diamide adenosyltransferase [Gemmatimonadales bacterium]|nr:MAG: cob(I)yrinic acid a,c-diamide adenosyltransferase [Gemmatimonadales bacterium]